MVEKFEEYLGPTSYSFEYGGVHFVMYNDIHAADAGGLFIQHALALPGPCHRPGS